MGRLHLGVELAAGLISEFRWIASRLIRRSGRSGNARREEVRPEDVIGSLPLDEPALVWRTKDVRP